MAAEVLQSALVLADPHNWEIHSRHVVQRHKLEEGQHC